MKIGILTQWYEPEAGPAALPAGLARGLVTRGHEVQVVTGFPNYPTGRIAAGYSQSRRHDEVRDGARVRRVALYPSHDSSSLRRIGNYGSFAVSALASGVGVLEDVDVLWVNYSPITVTLPMFWLRSRRRTPVVVHVLDLWPDTVTASGLGGGFGGGLERVLHGVCDRIYRSADTIAYISPGVGDVLAERGVPLHKLAYAPMWADESVHLPLPSRRGWGLAEGTVAVVYAGTLGGAQDLDTLIDACARVRELDIRCLIAGSGTHEEALRQRARSVGADNVTFLGRLNTEEVKLLTAVSDVHYVGLNAHPLAHMTMPSKVQAILASARPILGSLVGDAADVVNRSGGRTVSPGDVDGLEGQLRDLAALGRGRISHARSQARDFYEREFGYDSGVDRIERLLLAAAERHTHG